ETYRRGFERAMPRSDLTRVGIGSPEALLARQLASQQTAFAIAGDGPLQTDLFPVLEYQAPRAFFLGVTSKMLSQFDERTWQLEHASVEKRRVLASLTVNSVQQIFHEYYSINDDLFNELKMRIQKSERAAHP